MTTADHDIFNPIPTLLAVTQKYNGELLAYIEDKLTLNSQQKIACMAPKTQAIQVLAGAGTGKTMLITARTLKLLDDLLKANIPAPENRLLVLTFTEKAAGEMKHRIQTHLAKAGYRGTLPDTAIATFHSFCNTLLQRHSTELAHLPTEISLADSPQQQAEFDKLIQRIQQGLTQNIRSTLEVYHLHPIVGGSFEGTPIGIDCLSPKSLESLPISRLDAYLESFPALIKRIKAYGLQPDEFRAMARKQTIAFTETLKTLPMMQGGVPIETVDTLLTQWAKHLKSHASAFWFQQLQGYSEDYKVIKDQFGETLWRKLKDLYYVVAGKEATYGNKLKTVMPFDPAFLDEICQLELQVIDHISAFYALYQQALRRKGLLDFDDLINESIVLLRGNEPLRRRYQQWFEAILVDEFQDTNGSQLALLRLLMRKQPEYDHPNLMVVGDPKQSIYGFRFAQKENLNLIFEGIPEEQVLRLTLVNNYRSVPAVIACSNQVAQNLAETAEERQAEVPLVAIQKPKHTDEEAAIHWVTLGKVVGAFKNGEVKRESLGASQNSAEDAIALEVLRQVTQQGRKLVDCCVLVRSKLEGKRVATALQLLGIPYLLGADSLFFSQPEVQFTLAVLRLLHNATDTLAWTQLLQGVLSAKGLAQLLKLVRVASKPNEPFAKHFSPDLQTQLALQPTTVRALVVLAHFPVPDVSTAEADLLKQVAQFLLDATASLHQEDAINVVIKSTQTLLEAFNTQQSNTQKRQGAIVLKQCFYWLETLWQPLPAKAKQLTVLWKLIKKAQEDPQFKLPTLAQGLDGLQAVRIMTIHSAKGLEFPLVFVYWVRGSRGKVESERLLFDPQFSGFGGFGLMMKDFTQHPVVKPDFYRTIWHKHRESFEEQRLFYVALTRAKEQLWVFRHGTSAPWTQFPLSTASQEFRVLDEADEMDALWLENYANPQENKVGWQQQLEQQLERMVTQTTVAVGENEGAFAMMSATQKTKPTLTPAETAPIHINFSALEKLSQCATWYWRSAVMKEPIWEQKSTHSVDASTVLDSITLAGRQGSLVHRLIETYYRLGGVTEATASAYETVAQQALAGIEFVQAETIKQAALGLLTQFDASAYGWNALKTQGWRVMAPEQRLQFLLPPTNGSSDSARFEVAGQVDALFFNPETTTYRLVDFKTNAVLKPEKKALYFEQLALYAWGLRLNNPALQLPASQVELVHLSTQLQAVETHTLADFTTNLPTDGASTWLKRQLGRVVAGQEQTIITSHVPAPQVASPPCRQCPYAKQGCEHRVG
ncbi:MAG: UvrD-helicase domain-containing protein [Vampirovibrio sp.]|nr:UvrD-helicase domain-containing protein [Vampirovibrio sp.]